MNMEDNKNNAIKWSADLLWSIITKVKKSKLDNADINLLDIEPLIEQLVILNFKTKSLVKELGWSVEKQAQDEVIKISFSPSDIIINVVENANQLFIARVISLLPMIILAYRDCHEMIKEKRLEISISCGDLPIDNNTLCFSGDVPVKNLLVDPYFILSNGYLEYRKEVDKLKFFEERIKKIYWRGSLTGWFDISEPKKNQRVLMTNSCCGDKNYFDVGIIMDDNFSDDIKNYLLEKGLIGERGNQTDVLDYQFNIDVDGWSNSWTGFYIKLLSGSVTLKVASKNNFRQWYYDDLLPWVHYVPIAADCSDIIPITSYLFKNIDLAKKIASNSHKISNSMSFDSEIVKSTTKIISKFHENLSKKEIEKI